MPHVLTLSKTGCFSAGRREAASSRAGTPPPCELQDKSLRPAEGQQACKVCRNRRLSLHGSQTDCVINCRMHVMRRRCAPVVEHCMHEGQKHKVSATQSTTPYLAIAYALQMHVAQC